MKRKSIILIIAAVIIVSVISVIYLQDDVDDVEENGNNDVNGETVEALINSGTWTVPSDVYEIDVLVVGGGGGAGKQTGRETCPGAGGAGGLIFIQGYSVTPGTSISYSVGTGGLGGTYGTPRWYNGYDGGDSVFGNLVALGGGGGGRAYDSPGSGFDGGSGGGGGHRYDSAIGGSGIQPVTNNGYANSGFGNDGATAEGMLGGGGGGAGGPAIGHLGGPGKDFSHIFGTNHGNNGWFASGGGASLTGNAPVPNSGMGGRGEPSDGSSDDGENGASGIILIRYS